MWARRMASIHRRRGGYPGRRATTETKHPSVIDQSVAMIATACGSRYLRAAPTARAASPPPPAASGLTWHPAAAVPSRRPAR